MRSRSRTDALVLPVAILVAWQAFGSLGWLPSFLTRPSAFVQQLVRLMATGELLQQAGVSRARSLVGLALAAVFGVGLGLLAGVSRRVQGFCDPLISLTYPGAEDRDSAHPDRLVRDQRHLEGDPDRDLVLLAVLHQRLLRRAGGRDDLGVGGAEHGCAAEPGVSQGGAAGGAAADLHGLRVALAVAVAFILMFASETIGSSNRVGLGFLIISAETGGRFDLMFASMATIAALGFASDRLLLWVRRRVLHGRRGEAAA